MSLVISSKGECTLFTWQAPGGHELGADYWELVSASPAGGVDSVVTSKSNIDAQLDQRHLLLRTDDVSLTIPYHIMLMVLCVYVVS